MKNLPLLLLAFAICSFFSLNSCDKNDNDDQPTPDPLADTISIGFQETEWLTSILEAKFDSIVSESRCPCNADCIWAGSVTVLLNFNYAGETFSRELTLGAEPSSVIIGKYKVTLVEVLPYPCDVIIEPVVKVAIKKN